VKIAIDGRPTENASGLRGMGVYTRQLCRVLLDRNRSRRRPHSFTIFSSNLAKRYEAGAPTQRLPAIRRPARVQWMLDTWMLPRVLTRGRFDVFHATDITSIPVCRSAKIIAHVHDMIPFLFWNEYSRQNPPDYRWGLKLARKRLMHADYVVTISEHSKKDIVKLTGYPAERIYVAHLGAPEAPEESHRSGMNQKPYFIYVGGTDFRKNVPFLIRAFARFAAREPDIRLLLVGETFTMRSLPEVVEVLDTIRDCRIEDRVDLRGYVDDSELRRLYQESAALVFPSLYEGFGLPVLEAMTYGAPVVAAGTSSIPEVLGDTGLYFDPRDEDSLVAALETIYRDNAVRADFIDRARERSRLFSWNTVADVVFKIYEQLGAADERI
jgi:glycosyltransferase involved in cell wall biosynthesis